MAQEMQEKKPIYKKWWFWVIIAVVLIGIVAAAGGSGDSNTESSSNGTTAQTTKAETSKTSFQVGETYSDRNVKIAFVSANEDFKDIQDYTDVPDGKKVIQATFDFENVGSNDYLASNWDFKCFADNESCEEFIWVDNAGFSDTLSAGRVANGRSVYYTVPENASNIVLEYEPDFWSSKKIEFVVK